MSPRILVVDDEEAIVKLVSYNLQKEGFDTLAAVDGREAWEIIRQEKPDLIVLDIMMPEMDGFALCRPGSLLLWGLEFLRLPANTTPATGLG
jgi:two-component system alkaline phosphatase synthesis response regulator PhoP